MVGIVENARQRIGKDGQRFAKGNAMCLEVGGGLRVIPLELEAHRNLLEANTWRLWVTRRANSSLNLQVLFGPVGAADVDVAMFAAA